MLSSTRNWLNVFLSFASILCASCVSDGPKSASKNEIKAGLHLELGTTYMMKGQYPQALRELLIAAELNPNDPMIQNNLGLAYLVRNRFEESEKCFQKALTLNKNYTEARNNLGQLYIEVGLYDKAINELKTAANDLTYEYPDKSWANLGKAYFLKKDYENARSALLKSLKDRRESCYTMNYYGRSLFELQNFKLAAESFDQAVQFCEKDKFDEPTFYSALSFFKLGDHDRARARLTEFLQTYPQSSYAAKAQELLEIVK